MMTPPRSLMPLWLHESCFGTVDGVNHAHGKTGVHGDLAPHRAMPAHVGDRVGKTQHNMAAVRVSDRAAIKVVAPLSVVLHIAYGAHGVLGPLAL